MSLFIIFLLFLLIDLIYCFLLNIFNLYNIYNSQEHERLISILIWAPSMLSEAESCLCICMSMQN